VAEGAGGYEQRSAAVSAAERIGRVSDSKKKEIARRS
jgi:hypothetical protein